MPQGRFDLESTIVRRPTYVLRTPENP